MDVSKIFQTKNYIVYDSTYMKFKNKKINVIETRLVVAGWGWG